MSDVITVRSPYDDSVIGEIPAQTAADVDRAVGQGAVDVHRQPRHRRARNQGMP